MAAGSASRSAGKSPYKTLGDVWAGELGSEEGRQAWYAGATKYWEAQEATLDGILGGYPETNGPDLLESRQFLERLRRKAPAPTFGSVLDCGAGTGRVAAGLLLELFECVDLVEQDERLFAAARQEVRGPRAGRFIVSSLQQLRPEEDRYDVIWLQWVIMYLPDDDLQHFLQRCVLGLKENGVIFIKENVVLDGSFAVDWDDNSVARVDAQYKKVFGRAGLYVVQEQQQVDWPPSLIPVKMYALRPKAGVKRPALLLPADRGEQQQEQQPEQQEQLVEGARQCESLQQQEEEQGQQQERQPRKQKQKGGQRRVKSQMQKAV